MEFKNDILVDGKVIIKNKTANDILLGNGTTVEKTSLGASLLSKSFTYTSGAQTFTADFDIVQVDTLLVGNIALQRDSQYTVSGAVVTILDTLTSGAVIELNYWKANAVNATNYTKAESDGLFATKYAAATGLNSYETLALLPTTGTANISYKVTNDPTVSNNGYYHWSGTAYVKDYDLVNGVIESGNLKAVSGDTTFNYVNNIIEVTENSDLYYFTDINGAIVGSIDTDGIWHIKTEGGFINTDLGDHILAITDSEDKILFGIDKDGVVSQKKTQSKIIEDSIYYPYNFNNGLLDIQSLISVNNSLLFPSIAKGRESTLGANDRPEVPLTTEGYAHPKVLFIPSGWNGYTYWAVLTPTFGIIAQQTDVASYENPHIFCSNDGVVWIEPVGINNPIDQPQPADVNQSYWSDGHLELGDDAYLHLYYRGNSFSNNYFGDGLTHSRFVVHRKSKDGVNWSDKELLYSDLKNGVDSGSGLLSPCFIKNGSFWHCFDGVRSTATNPIPSQKNQSQTFIQHRLGNSFNSDFGDYNQDSIVNFKNRPWGVDNDIWHLEAIKWKNTWWLLLNTAPIGVNDGLDLYLAYSGDGWNFDVIETPLFIGGTYRSSIIPVLADKEFIKFKIYRNRTKDGSVSLHNLTLKYI